MWGGGGAHLEPGGVDEARDDVDERVELEHRSERRVRVGVVLVPLKVVGVHNLVDPGNPTGKKKQRNEGEGDKKKQHGRVRTDTRTHKTRGRTYKRRRGGGS